MEVIRDYCFFLLSCGPFDLLVGALVEALFLILLALPFSSGLKSSFYYEIDTPNILSFILPPKTLCFQNSFMDLFSLFCLNFFIDKFPYHPAMVA